MATLILNIPDTLQHSLSQKAQAHGLSLEHLVLQLLREASPPSESVEGEQNPSPKPSLRQDWANRLEAPGYTALDLQHQAQAWR